MGNNVLSSQILASEKPLNIDLNINNVGEYPFLVEEMDIEPGRAVDGDDGSSF